MNRILTEIEGITYVRVSKTMAKNLCKDTETPVYMFPVKMNPNSPWACGVLVNNSPLDGVSFNKRVAEFIYYNRSSQYGYYAAFYAPLFLP